MKKVAAIALVLAMNTSHAGAAGTVYKLLDICRFDIDQYCKTINRKYTKMLKECLEKHEKDLLPRCQDYYKRGI
jgi:Flp pilus assembly CpaF family ATPase